MRDKAGKQAFDQSDVPKAQRIADRIIVLFANKNVFGQRFIVLSEADAAAAPPASGAAPFEPKPLPVEPAPPPAPSHPSPEPPPAPRAPAPVAPPLAGSPALPSLLDLLVREAQTAMTRIIVPPPLESLTEAELVAVREVLRAILLIPGALAAMFTGFGQLGGIQEIATSHTLADDALQMLQSKVNAWLTKRGEARGFLRLSVLPWLEPSAATVTASQIEKVFTAPVVAGSLRGLYLTAAFSNAPDRGGHEILAALLKQLQLSIENSMSRAALQAMRIRAAEKLLEPDLARYPELRRHTDAVVAVVEQFSRFLSLAPREAENVRLVAMVHDVGMRLLDYERLYRKHTLSRDEIALLREHPAVGAAVIEPLLGRGIARAVLCHHERVDGRGYPNELHDDEIPFASRVVQICDSWAAMTDPRTYQPPSPPEAALAIIVGGAGTQFDRELARRFADMMRSGSGSAAK